MLYEVITDLGSDLADALDAVHAGHRDVHRDSYNFV